MMKGLLGFVGNSQGIAQRISFAKRKVKNAFGIDNSQLFDWLSQWDCAINCGAYCYFWNGYCVYVGATSRIKQRAFRIFGPHKVKLENPVLDGVKKLASDDKVCVLIFPAEKDKLAALEAFLFDCLKPFSQVQNRKYVKKKTMPWEG